MAVTLQDLKDAAADLPTGDRAALAHYLLSTLDEDNDGDADAAWQELAESRMEDVRSGRVVGIPAESVLRNLPGSQQR